MKEVNVMNTEQTATHAMYKMFYYGIRGILWLYSAQCLLVRQRKKGLC